MGDHIPTSVGEATIERTAEGVRPVGEGWLVVNVADLAASGNPRMGITGSPEPTDHRFPEVGVNVRVLESGQFNARYHRENAQEAFLVLSGECILIVEGEERRLRSGDFFHSPPLTGHVFIGAGDRACTILMVGGRTQEWCGSPKIAYADVPADEPARVPWPPAGIGC